MLGVVFVLIPGLVGYLYWSSNRRGREQTFEPGAGRQRWTETVEG